MTSELSERRREALALCYQLTESRPGMFGGRERRPIVEAAPEAGEAITRIVLLTRDEL